MARMTQREKYTFKRLLDELGAYKGRATELITLYVPPSKLVSDVAGYLRNESSQSSNIKSKSTRKNVMAAIESIMSRLRGMKKVPESGIVFFTGHIPVGADQTRMITRTVQPPTPVSIFMYRCDSYFYLDHLREMLIEDEVYGMIVIDRSEATVGILNGKRIDVIKNISSLVPSKHGRGGQSAQRFERLIEIAAHEYYKKVGDLCTESFLGIDELKGILIGGPGSTKDYFLSQEYIHHELKKKVVDTFDTGYTNEYGLTELLEKATPALQHLEVSREKGIMSRLFTEIRKEDGGLSLYGQKDVRGAIELGAVGTLLVSEGLKKYHRVLSCPLCGEKLDQYVTDKDQYPGKCRKDNTPYRIEVQEDLVDELAAICEAYSTKMELISTESAEGDMLLRAFGGMAAILRYRLNSA